jgi:hypothetical protein
MVISNSLTLALRNARNKIKKQKSMKKCTNENTEISHSFLAIGFFRGFCLSQHQRSWNLHKILCCFDSHIDIFQ